MSIATIWANDPSCHRILLLRPYRRYRRWSRLLERRRLQKFASRKFSSNKKSKTFFESQVWKKILYTKSLLRSWLWLIFFTKTFRTFPAVAAKNRRYQFRPLHLEKPFLADLAAFGAPEKIDNGKSVTKTNKQTNAPPFVQIHQSRAAWEGLVTRARSFNDKKLKHRAASTDCFPGSPPKVVPCCRVECDGRLAVWLQRAVEAAQLWQLVGAVVHWFVLGLVSPLAEVVPPAGSWNHRKG